MTILATWYRSDFYPLDEAAELLVTIRHPHAHRTGPWERAYRDQRKVLEIAIQRGEISIAGWNSRIHQGRHQFIPREELESWLRRKRLFPAHLLGPRHPQPQETGQMPAGSLAQARAWLLDEMRASPARKPQPKSSWKKTAQQRFGLSGGAFDRLWTECIAASGAYGWGLAGRPSSKS